MNYVTENDLLTRVGTTAANHLADEDGDGTADPAVLAEIVSAADADVDARLANRYRLPIDPLQHPAAANALRSAALDLAEYRLRARRPPVATEIAAQFARAVQWLDGIAAGRIRLPGDTGIAAAPAPGTLTAETSGEPRTLSREDLAPW